VKHNWPLLLAILTGPIGMAVLAITRNWNKIKSGATSVKDWVVSKFGSLKNWLAGVPAAIGRAFGKLSNFLTAPFRSAFNGIASLWNRTVGSLSFTVPGWVPGFGGSSFSLPQIPQLAQGGIVRARSGGTLVNVGEGGQDEAVVPLPKGGAGGLMGGGRLDVHLTFDAREFKRMLRAEIRTGGLLEGIRLSSSTA
jgi:hypothetical protein